MKFCITILKYHLWYLCPISHANHAITFTNAMSVFKGKVFHIQNSRGAQAGIPSPAKISAGRNSLHVIFLTTFVQEAELSEILAGLPVLQPSDK